jgi:hypothetical protein
MEPRLDTGAYFNGQSRNQHPALRRHKHGVGSKVVFDESRHGYCEVRHLRLPA